MKEREDPDASLGLESAPRPSPPTPRLGLELLDPYVPGRRARSAAGSLASNEFPLGPSELVRAAVGRAAEEINRYPDPLASELRSTLALEIGTDPDEILIGNGSDELIYLLVMAYAAAGGTAVCAAPPYRVHEIACLAQGAQVTRVPMIEWRQDLAQMAAAEADLAFVCNPHNPTGTAHPREEIESFVRDSRARLVIIDEAYIDFADDPAAMTALPQVASGRVAVLRTFSKIGGLAGARLGYLVAGAEVVGALRTIRPSFSVSSIAQAAGRAVLADQGYREMVRSYTLEARDRLARLLRSHGIESVPSQANFLLVIAPNEGQLVAHLETEGISVRPGTSLGIAGTVRISMPSQEGFRMLERALQSLPIPGGLPPSGSPAGATSRSG
ncbi:MAG TPA: histidinol-phosphate transaminase [Candidatus Saccharimonadales bacterium]|nr:histidinol-phosphate transaminase [Candidatus Saccharimonadales bacterium]